MLRRRNSVYLIISRRLRFRSGAVKKQKTHIAKNRRKRRRRTATFFYVRQRLLLSEEKRGEKRGETIIIKSIFLCGVLTPRISADDFCPAGTGERLRRLHRGF
ncbi:MAG: hypothetical protein DBX40_06535 [Clostridiales bacterium]|nr:MAG: hypothetical protein DBX40_06535 [Clostridiales bacterium]